MASPGGDEGQSGDLDSLFEGMVLIDSSELLPPSSSPNEVEIASSSASISSSLPLDEDLFSDLTILTSPTLDPNPVLSTRSSDVPMRNPLGFPADLSPSSTPETPPLLQSSRSIPRKKKKAIKIGYARDTVIENTIEVNSREDSGGILEKIEEDRHLVERRPKENEEKEENFDSPTEKEDSREESSGVVEKIEEDQDLGRRPKDDEEKEEETDSLAEKEDLVASVERKFDNIRAEISGKISEIKKTVGTLLEERKSLRRKRRNAVDSVNVVSVKFKDLERELEAACDVEDFERAEILSESIAVAEKEKGEQLKLLRRAEEEFDAVDLKIQQVLEALITAEEESIALLEKFSQEAGDNAEKIKTHASEIYSSEMAEWQQSMETLESKKLQIEIESNIVNEASSGILSHIERLTEADRLEKEALTNKGAILERELDELQELIKQKQTQISENNQQIQQVEEKISKIVSEFGESESTIIEKLRFLQNDLSELESKSEDLLKYKKEIEESLGVSERKSLRLKELAEISVEETMICRDMVESRKSMASDVMKVREDKMRLAKMEEDRSAEVQKLQQLISAARSSLQELSLTRVRIQEEMTTLTQRISFIDKKVPELEAEKRAAAAARNFKEAARASSEAKALHLERETAQVEKNQRVNDLEKVNKDIEYMTREMEEREELVLVREKEAAVAAWERLCLEAATARAELAAADSGESEEGKILLEEAVTAEAKARELGESYGLDLESDGNSSRCLMSLPIIISLSGLDSSLKKIR